MEDNLLGTANRASLSLRKDPDRTGIITVLRAPRLIAGRVPTSAQYVQFANASDGRILWGQVAQPYYSLSTRTAWSVTAEDRRQRVLRFFEGEDVASDTPPRRMSSISAA